MNRWAATALIAALVLCAGWLGWICRYDHQVPFLPDHRPADWIVYPKPPDTMPRPAAAVSAEFKRTFALDIIPSVAQLRLCAFRQGSVTLNGQTLSELNLAGQDWKRVRVLDVARWLRAGTNQIAVTVSNRFGPPALWLALVTDRSTWRTDSDWRVSLAGAIEQNAAIATQPPAIRPGNQLFGSEPVTDSIARTWPSLALLLALAIAVVWFATRWVRSASNGSAHASSSAAKQNLSAYLVTKASQPAGILVLLLTAWGVLFANNLPQLASVAGFDRDGHTEYVNYILQNGSLPLADAGWQMYQPPLFYLISAALLALPGWSASTDGGLMILRVLSALLGALHLWVLWLCLRQLFPSRPSSQIVGLLLGALLPAHLYLSHHVTNEGLAALFVTTTLYFTLRCLQSNSLAIPLHLAAGLCLGLAMLSKFSAVLAVPFVFGALAWHACQGHRGILAGGSPLAPAHYHKTLKRLRGPAFAIAAFGAACGWHYARVWLRFGRPLVGNWDPNLPFAWWQDPGYHTASWYTHFGQALATPWFSSLSSFLDGIYSSLWGDNLGSGSARIDFRPQWNYDMMNAACWLAVPLTCLLVLGTARALIRFLRRPDPAGFLLGGLSFAFAFGLIYMTLRVPSYAQVKAFYVLPALLPFCALAAAGWECCAGTHDRFRATLWTGLLAWVLTTYAAFWIRSGHPFTYTAQAMTLADDGRYAEAAAKFTQALELDPNAPGARTGLAATLDRLDRHQEAAQQIALALQHRPNSPNALIQAAVNLAAERRHPEAAQRLRDALVQAPDHPVASRQLAACLRLFGPPGDVLQAAHAALRINPFEPDLHLWTGKAAIETGDPALAAAHLRLALDLKPGLTDAMDLLALALFSLGRFDQAAAQYEKGLEFNPLNPGLRYQFALCLSALGRNAAAADQYRQTLAIQPDHVEALNNLAWLLAANSAPALRNGNEAVRLAERAAELTQYREPVLLGTLAAAYAEAGRFANAVATAEKARDLAAAANNDQVAQKNRELLELYRAGKPFHEP